jgi:hypothetical protein
VIGRHPSPPLRQPHRPVPADLVGRCFNCLRQDHVAVDCSNVLRCLCCHREGHYARACKHPRSPDTSGPPPLAKRPQMVAVLHPRLSDVALSQPHPPHAPRRTSVGGRSNRTAATQGPQRGPSVERTFADPPGGTSAPAPEGSPSRHILPSPPPPSSPLASPPGSPMSMTSL